MNDAHQNNISKSKKTYKIFVLTRLTIIFLLTALASYFYRQDLNQRYQMGVKLTKETYIEQYNSYKNNLLKAKPDTNLINTVFTVYVGICILVGSYELIVYLISLIIKKVVEPRYTSQSLNSVNPPSTSLNYVDLSHANLSGTNLSCADLSRANLREANLENSCLQGANLREANLREANLKNTLLQGANLEGANLSKANLENTLLQGANLKGANLSEANLENTLLQGANLSEANLENIRLQGVTLSEANIQKYGLTPEQIKNIKN